QVSKIQRNGQNLYYGYNESNQLITITDFNDLETDFAYTGAWVTSLTDPADRTTALEQNEAGQLISITDPESALWQYGDYETAHLPSLIDPLDHETDFTYGFAGRIDTVTRPDETTESLVAVQMQGLVAGGEGTEESPATPLLAVQASANYTDGRDNVW